MSHLRSILSSALSLVCLGVLLTGCGVQPQTRQLVSISISPATATNTAQFVATGIYNSEPYTVTPLTVGWGATVSRDQISLSTTGLASCVSGTSGTIGINGWVLLPPNGAPECNVVDTWGTPICQPAVIGSAKLTCP
jgi:hypothetical protein